MYVEEVIIEGFKSYAKRTAIKGFDPLFNAITGLNGSGKSNILDSICFVLGISNLSQVRARSLQELVYKQGQAGVTKASVTVVFRNDDRSRSPVGYENCATISVTREVAVGGRNRYAVNGRSAQAGQVANLFHSVQLNVNNPHFLIMQGRITKVLNMKPSEILGMVEEAAGTRMFEHKKEGALKTLEKKENKVKEIERVLAEDIAPTLEKLRADKARYLRWSANTAAAARLERFCVAHEYDSAQKHSAELAAAYLDLKQRAEDQEKLAIECLKQAEEQLKDSTSQEDDSSHEIARQAWKDAEREVVRLNASYKTAQSVLKNEESALAAGADAAKKAFEKRNKQREVIAQLEDRLHELTTTERETQIRADAATETHREACAGRASSGADAKLSELRTELAQHQSTLKRCQAEQNAAIRKRESHAAAAKKHATELARLEKVADTARTEMEKVESEWSAAASLTDDNDTTLTVRQALEHAAEQNRKVREAKSRAERLQTQLEARLGLDLADDCPCDRAKVRGRLASLVKPLDRSNSAGLEVVAGGKLFHVVVDDQDTGKKVLDKGRLKQRTTVIPLDRVAAPRIESSRVERAAEICKHANFKARPALEFVGYPEEVRAAIAYAFGSTLLCESLDQARQVAFDAKVRTKCVTLDGDVCNPAGTLTGGSQSGRGMGALLGAVFDLAEARDEVGRLEDEYDTLAQKAQHLETTTRARRDLEARREIARAKFEEAQEAARQSPAAIAADSLQEMNATLDALTLKIQSATDDVHTCRQQLKTLEDQGISNKKKRDAALEAQRRTAEAERKALREASKRRADTEAALKDAKALLHEDEDEAEHDSNALKVAEDELSQASDALKRAQDERDIRKAAFEIVDTERKETLRALKKLEAAKEAAHTKASEAQLEAKRLTTQAQRIDREKRDKDNRLNELLTAHSWIEPEKQFFGRPGGDYDFSQRDAATARQELEKLASDQDELARNLNRRVMGAIEDAERQYDDLTKKRDAVSRDRAKIQNVIAELDEKKKATLLTTVAAVDADFGSIFSTLLPGTSAKLAPPPGGHILDGLQVRVAFGSIWKQSLSELSGGQRSLIALSLVLAMLKFKPAPMYILDEVDAALDLSHTQNIGTMLKRHFKDAQFLVVSLKEGMFNNANVIFRTKFVDGVSTVTRTLGSSSAQELDDDPSAAADAEPTKKKIKPASSTSYPTSQTF